MVTSGTDQAVRQHGTSQMGNSEAATFVTVSEAHVLILDMCPLLKTALAVNVTQMLRNDPTHRYCKSAQGILSLEPPLVPRCRPESLSALACPAQGET